jgi:hypothetical protein
MHALSESPSEPGGDPVEVLPLVRENPKPTRPTAENNSHPPRPEEDVSAPPLKPWLRALLIALGGWPV